MSKIIHFTKTGHALGFLENHLILLALHLRRASMRRAGKFLSDDYVVTVLQGSSSREKSFLCGVVEFHHTKTRKSTYMPLNLKIQKENQ